MMTHMSWMIPISRLRETAALMVFFHPKPSYEFHILIVSKRPYATLVDAYRDLDGACFHQDLAETVISLVDEFDLERKGYRLITNGGPYQDIPQLHYHLVSGRALSR